MAKLRKFSNVQCPPSLVVQISEVRRAQVILGQKVQPLSGSLAAFGPTVWPTDFQWMIRPQSKNTTRSWVYIANSGTALDFLRTQDGDAASASPMMPSMPPSGNKSRQTLGSTQQKKEMPGCSNVNSLHIWCADFWVKKQSHPVVEPRSFAPSCSRFVVFLKPTCWICGRKGHRTKTHIPHQKITISGRLTIVKVKNNNLFPAKFNMSQEHRHIIQKITQNQQIFFFQVTLQRDGLQLGA